MTTLQDSRVLRVRSLGLKRRRASTVRAGLRPWIESLEDRAVPASLLYVDATWPGVSIPAPIVDVGGTPHTIGVDAFNTIQAAVDAAENGAVINVLAGSYDEAVTINKPVTLQGAGQAQTDVKRGMLITSPIVGDLRVGLKDLSIHAAQSVQISSVAGLSTYGIRIDATAADTAPITFDHVTTQSPITLKPIGVAPSSQIYGSGILILPNNHVINDLNFTAVTASNNYTHGLLISDTSGKLGGTVSNLTIADSFFDSNNVKAVVDGSPGASGYGLYFNAPTAASSIVVTGVNVSNTSISNNRLKGAYLETLAHAAFTNINVTGNGGYANLAPNGPAGFQLNLKYGTYHDIRIESSTFTNNGLANTATGAGLSIQPRNDGIYAPIPASLANLQIVNSTISGSPIPLTLAYNLDYASTTLSGVSLNGSVVGLTMYNGTAGQTLNLGDTSFNAALPTYISSASSIVTHAESAVFDGIVGQNLTNAQAFAVSAKIGDALDPTIGLAGTVYLRPNELFVNSGAGNLPRGIAAAVAGDRIHVNSGTYVENLTIAKGIAVEGETGTILNVPSGDGISVTGVSGTVELKQLQVTHSPDTIVATGINASTDGTLKIENVNITGFSTDALAFASTGGTGSLAVSGSLTADKPIAVRSGKLIGTGVVQGAIVDSAASVIPGPLPGVLQVDALALASGSTTSFEIDGPSVGDQYTQLKTPGVLDLTGVNLSLHFGAGYIPDDGASFTLVKGGTISGQFVGLPEKALIPVGSKFANISYVGGTGNDVVLSMQFQPIFTGLSDQSRVYGTASTEFTGTISAGADIPVGQTVKITLNGVSHDVTIASDGGFASTFDISGLTPGGSPYTVSYAYAGQGAFRSAEGSSKLSIGSKSLTITALPASKTYGDTLTFTGTEFTVTGLNDGDFVSSVTLVSAGTAPDARVPNSPYVIEASNAVGSGLEKYVITYQNGRLSVNAKALTISAGSTSKTYGDTVNFSGNEYTTSGLINGDTVESVTLNSAGAQANARVDGSPYRIIPSGVSGNGLDNYHINYVDGNLTVGRKSLSITASPRSKTYGSAAVFNGTEFTTSGLINGDLVRGATLQSDGAPVGATVAGSPYAIVPSAAFGSGLNNYEITYVNGNLSVGAKPLSIKAESTSKTYGGTVNFAGTEFTSSGLVNGDQVSRVVLRSEGAAAAAPVAGSPYAVVPGDASGTGLGNYAITYLNGSLTVGTKALTILAGSIGKVYGDTVVFAGTEFLSDGLVNNDSITSVTLRSAGAAATASAFGSPYAITASEAVGTGLSNYAITYANGQLAVARRALFVQANSFSKTYGGTIGFQGTEFTTSGLVNGDKVSRVVLSSPGQTYNASVADSPYPVIPKNAYGTGLTNYAIEYLNGGLAVNPKALTITARSTTKTYGTTVNLVGTEFTSSGLIYGDTVTKVTLASNGTAPNAGVQGTPYAINASDAVGKGIGNYAINYVPGRLNVLAKALTITANYQTIPFGSNPKPFTATYAGFANGETAADLATPPQFRTTAGPKSPAGRYVLYVSGATSPNYTIRFVNGVVTVLPYVQPADFAQRSATAFITTLYVEVLGREPGTDGLNYWVPKVLAGQSKANIFQLFSTSPERKALEKAGTAPTIPLSVAYADALKAAQNPPPAVPAGPLALLASRRGR